MMAMMSKLLDKSVVTHLFLGALQALFLFNYSQPIE